MKSDVKLKALLEQKHHEYNRLSFIDSDPISIPHAFTLKEDIEISAFLTATISWGNRKSIIKNANRMMMLLDHSPYDFVLNHEEQDLKSIQHFVHRTFNNDDFLTFIHCLQQLYKNKGGLEDAFSTENLLEDNLKSFPDIFLGELRENRVSKHVAKISRNSAAKRINMFLRWMVRKDDAGVDFGIWKRVSSSQLFIPLDVHSGNVARKLGLLSRKQNDWRAVKELTESLRSFDDKDPIKYDYALFGMGVFEHIT